MTTHPALIHDRHYPSGGDTEAFDLESGSDTTRKRRCDGGRRSALFQ